MKIDYCGGHDSPAGHHSMSKAMNATGRNMVLALCRGPYQGEDHWGYAPEVAQVWRATGDHHDEFSSTMKQVMSVKGKSSWSSPHNWAYLDMMMTGGQGCASQCNGSRDDTGVGENSFTSGFDGPWTRTPTTWNNEVRAPWQSA